MFIHATHRDSYLILLKSCFQASTLLDENNAQYSEKINYNNPQHLSVEALELHYRINASILKYLEIHEGKEISNTMGEFFKKCLDSSKFLKKSVPKVITEHAPKDVAEPPPKLSERSGSLGFQEQFLNSLNKLNSVPLENENVEDAQINDIVKEEKIPILVDHSTKELEKVENDQNDLKVIEDHITENVITISDSEEEKEKLKRINGE